MFKITPRGVLRIIDNSSIPNSFSNIDWQEYQKWLDSGNTPDPQYTLEEYKDLKISETKQEASKRIFNLNGNLPIWRQMNFAAKAVELIEKKLEEPLSVSETAELDYFKNIWNQVKDIRSASNLIEDEINGSSDPESIDIGNHILWP